MLRRALLGSVIAASFSLNGCGWSPLYADPETVPADAELRGIRIAPEGTAVRNPSFDVTPAELITAIVTEEGAIRQPFDGALREAMDRRDARREAAREAKRPYAIPQATPIGSAF